MPFGNRLPDCFPASHFQRDHRDNIPFSMFRGTNHQVAFDLVNESPIPRSHEPPAYGVIFLNSDGVIIHYHDFLDRTAFIA